MEVRDYNSKIHDILQKVALDSKVEVLETVLIYLEEIEKEIYNLDTCVAIIKALQNRYKELSNHE